MGGGRNSKSKSNKKNKKKKDSSSRKGASGGGSVSGPPFDVSASLLRLEKRYDELMLDAARRLQKEEDEYDEDIVTTEYVVAARDRTGRVVADWVPVAQLCLARTWRDAHASEGSSDPAVRAALSLHCREISHVAGLGSRVFPSIPRSDLEYSVETIDSFHKYVYEAVIETPTSSSSSDSGNQQAEVSSSGKNDSVAGTLTKQEARAVLQITEDEECSLRDVKSQYRKRSFDCHPDRMVQRDSMTDVERQAMAEEYSRVKLAYEVLTHSGWARKEGSSWYESLGGRSRTDFVGPIELMPIAAAEAALKASSSSCQCAIIGLDPDMVQAFVTRIKSSKS